MRFVSRLDVLATAFATAATATMVGVSLTSIPVIHAADDPSKPAYYTEKVAPILQNTCSKCHGGPNHRGTYNMSTREAMFKGGKHGIAIVPGHPEQSKILIAINRTGGDDKPPKPMPPPPKPKLSAADIAIITEWIKAGAPTTDGTLIDAAPNPEKK